jgi:tRNA threonylcarbamoyladenosine biosynthesis protein TsaB
MIVLAIETATDMVGVALLRGDGAVAERVHEGGRAHAELLAPSIEEVCAASACAIGEITCIAVDIGPGLFTGLRVGVATAKALAQALGIGVLGVSSLDILAAGAAERWLASDGGPGPFSVASVVDARRGEVFAATYRFEPVPGPDPVDPESVRLDRNEPLGPEALSDWLVERSEVEGPVTVVGDGAVRYHHLLSSQPGLDLRWAGDISAPSPVTQARLAAGRLARGVVPSGATELVPDYRRPADARINWEQRAPRPTDAGSAGRTGEGAG